MLIIPFMGRWPHFQNWFSFFRLLLISRLLVWPPFRAVKSIAQNDLILMRRRPKCSGRFTVCQARGDAARTASDRQTTGHQHWAANNNNNNLKRHGRRQHNSRPCFICPGSSMLISPDRYDDADVAYNGVDAQQHADGAVRMPEPVVRPCLYSNKYIYMLGIICTQNFDWSPS